jgi:excisionase family DNA binding protein
MVRAMHVLQHPYGPLRANLAPLENRRALRERYNDRLTMSTNLDLSLWISQSEAARWRSVSRQAISNLVKKGRFRTLNIGGKVLVHRQDVESFEPKLPGPAPKAVRLPKKAAKPTNAKK